MKKTLAAVAVLGAFAGSALAADVQLYGIVDTGVGYNHVDVDGLGDGQDIDTFIPALVTTTLTLTVSATVRTSTPSR